MANEIYEHVKQLLADDTQERAKRTVILVEDPILDEEIPIVEAEVITLPPKTRPFIKRVPIWAWLLSCGLSVFLLVSLFLLIGLPLLSLSATVTIYPQTQVIHTDATLILSHVRVLSSMTISQAVTLPTTGHGHQDAISAQGRLTFYNALESIQTIPEGTMLISATGVQVVTDQPAIIPAGTLTQNGFASVPAHVLTPGASGNLPAGNIHGPCCRAYVLVASSAFIGGKDARDYPAVAQSDIDQAGTTVRERLDQRMTTAVAEQQRPSETLTPLACSETTTPDHAAGQEATTVTVTLRRTCQATAYLADAFTDQARAIITTLVPPSYILVSNIQATMTNTIIINGILHISAHLSGTVAYHLSQSEIHLLTREIAGKTKAEAAVLLLRHAGIRQVILLIQPDRDQLPQNADHIHITLAGW